MKWYGLSNRKRAFTLNCPIRMDVKKFSSLITKLFCWLFLAQGYAEKLVTVSSMRHLVVGRCVREWQQWTVLLTCSVLQVTVSSVTGGQESVRMCVLVMMWQMTAGCVTRQVIHVKMAFVSKSVLIPVSFPSVFLAVCPSYISDRPRNIIAQWLFSIKL